MNIVTVIFRCDSSTLIGFGHLMRCLTLGCALRDKGANVSFITRAFKGHQGHRITDLGFKLTLLPFVSDPVESHDVATEYVNWINGSQATDAHDTKVAIGTDPVDWLVVDNYAFSHVWHAAMEAVTSKILVIDDLANRPYQASLLLDQTYGRDESAYKPLVQENTKLLVGAQYTILRDDFLENRSASLERRKSIQKIDRVNVSMGGTDAHDTTTKVLTALEASELASTTKIDVVLASDAPHHKQVSALAAVSRFQVTVHSNVSNMAALMSLADFSVGAAGSTTWERCCLGLPMILLVTAENQQNIANNLGAAQAAKVFNTFDPDLHADMLASINKLVRNPEGLIALSAKCAEIVDGKGVHRVCEHFCS